MMQRKYQIVTSLWTECNAGMKAPKDAVAVLRSMGAEDLNLECKGLERELPWCIGSMLRLIRLILLVRRIQRGDVCFVQFPGGWPDCRVDRFIFNVLKKRGVRFVGLVHDIVELQFNDAEHGLKPWTRQFFEVCDKIIVHNRAMRTWLVAQGVDDFKLVEIGLFDYLSDDFQKCQIGMKCEIVVAGVLRRNKCGYLYNVGMLKGLLFNAYGPKVEVGLVEQDNVHYKGVFHPDELIQKLCGGWGLVWDGDSIDECTGVQGTYLKYNNPHKVSLYLAAGLPVIVWRKSAVAAFVREHNVGITVNSLSELCEVLPSITAEQYELFCNNVCRVATMLRSGSMLTNALKRTGLWD